MSKNDDILDALCLLIQILDDRGVIDVVDLIEKLKVEEVSIVVAKKNMRYEEIAGYLKRGIHVFIEGSRQKMSYAKKRLSELGVQIKYTRAVYGGKAGYLISPANL